MRTLSSLLLIAAMLLVVSSAQAAKQTDGQGHVVHTRLAPVLLHRAVPPFKGMHTYQGESQRTAPKK